METEVYTSLAALGCLCFFIHRVASKAQPTLQASNPDFLRFQRLFFVVYFPALFSDWLQGPYVYKLYSHYGFAESQIAVLYVVGFAASILFGTSTGPLADRFGRRLMCVCFAVLYSICCFTKLSPDYFVLLFGRILGGISTSMLFSSFEAWYVYEHREHHGFPVEWISSTFSKATFFNGLLAIVAGIIANFAAETMSFGPVAPFMMAVPCLVVAGIGAGLWWPENRGSVTPEVGMSCMKGLRYILSDLTTLQLGMVQALFEAVMYIFVFLWTPMLEPAKPPLGLVFSCFMVAIMIGSSIYSICTSKKIKSEQVLLAACGLALCCTLVCAYSSGAPLISLGAFILLEICVGMYYPAIGSLRSQVVPEQYRANIINWFRVPMNLITCGGLLWLHSGTENNAETNRHMFLMCTVVLAGASYMAYCFCQRFKPAPPAATIAVQQEPLLKPEGV
ncbi:molybdate-anion transporter-like [Neocloeon triangulifer]|uniref:molybdate-anion transporter-like n=1 Tax=Neocloeon triangulifer TaxID=2078957 RepID=UPI00286F331C|nr:molybdate-anion transporter-like [Neocloeon triangulifer]XP_059469373.1 molybdate-anion transporter-like [Neocloeon triangulifer]XP_059469374.1 molybdate-anion transporter-like [Neocloeon triangulifer]XP_059469375.1 molybdate-anion transporter-like [Neocloeon triangulifer]